MSTQDDKKPAIVSLASDGLSAEVSELGAELVRLRDDQGQDLLWDGDPRLWAGRAPLLFPIVGRVANDHLRVDGVDYPIRQHGVARISRFAVLEAGPAQVRFELRADAETRKSYPFDFRLEVAYALEGAALTVRATVTNTDERPLPAAFGFHPAFRWPLPFGHAREDYAISFEREEAAPIRRLKGGLMEDAAYPSPVRGNRLDLTDALFRDDALIFDRLESREVEYGAANGPAIRVSFPDMPQLGLWSKAGAGFVCIEPWHGYASPQGFDGEFIDKPGMMILPPGSEAAFAMRIELLPEARRTF